MFCPNIGCSTKTVKAHRLEHHLRFDCDSKVLVRRRLLVERARKRSHYARPWGLEVEPMEENEIEKANRDEGIEHGEPVAVKLEQQSAEELQSIVEERVNHLSL